MGFKEFLKRVLPFFLTFALGLLIASFFVSITPNFKFEKRGWNSRHRQYHQRLELDNQRLRDENEMLKRKLAEAERLNPKIVGAGRGNGGYDVPKIVVGKGEGNGSGSGNGNGTVTTRGIGTADKE